MMTNTLDTLANAAAEIAMQGFAEYVRRHDVPVDDYEKACELLRKHTKARLPEALDDAREAFDAHMDAIGRETFVCSLRKAGIDAASEYIYDMTHEFYAKEN